jgi:hypothetical protein
MKPIVRVQLVALVALIGLVVYSQTRGADVPDGAVVLRDLDDRLGARTFRLDRAQPVVVLATAAPGSDGRYQAFPWIVDRSSRRVVFHPDSLAPRERGRRVDTFRDTLRLQPGTYDVFYTPFGRDGRGGSDSGFLISFDAADRWRGSRDDWTVEVTAADGSPLRSERWSFAEARAQGEGVLWSTYDSESQIVQVVRPDTLHLTAVTAEMARRGDDVVVTRLPDDREVWRLADAQPQPSGGADRYSRADARLPLEPGFYRIANDIDLGNPLRWRANPPLDVASYGLTVRGGGGIRSFGVWGEDAAPAVSIAQPGNDAYVRRPFVVRRTVDAVVYAMGEVEGDSDRYDYALIRDEETGRTVWEMRRSQSHPAGGARNLRVAEEIVRLDPGRYELVYLSDDSRSPDDDFLGRPPDHPERWGAFVFAPFDTSAVTGRVAEDERPTAPLAEVVRVRSDQERTTVLTLDAPTRVRVEALLEWDGDWYDTARIVDTATGDVVWAAERVDPVPDVRERDFAWARSVLTLAPGTYTLSVQTDASLAYDDWNGSAPSMPERYGLAVYPLDR